MFYKAEKRGLGIKHQTGALMAFCRFCPSVQSGLLRLRLWPWAPYWKEQEGRWALHLRIYRHSQGGKLGSWEAGTKERGSQPWQLFAHYAILAMRLCYSFCSSQVAICRATSVVVCCCNNAADSLLSCGLLDFPCWQESKGVQHLIEAFAALVQDKSLPATSRLDVGWQ